MSRKKPAKKVKASESLDGEMVDITDAVVGEKQARYDAVFRHMAHNIDNHMLSVEAMLLASMIERLWSETPREVLLRDIQTESDLGATIETLKNLALELLK